MTTYKTLCLLLANALIPISIYYFAIGFFPYKPFLPGLASFEELEDGEELQLLREGARPERAFDKVIFMVVDALRSDFVYSNRSGFEFTQSLINDGTAMPFTAHASPPTVTMPRVKALTTGSVPTFVDFILNFAESDTTSSLATQDTWLAQIRQHIHAEASGGRKGRLDFYGDDTWLKLFPDFFTKHDGTTSFFVSDFTEVDNNVTRHLPSILDSDEWDGVIAHYLGLDHIGHKTGPLGPHMVPKQKEMDGIVKQIYTAIETKKHLSKTLLVLVGDHGMNNGGNHGGSSDGETSTALLFMSPKFKSIDRTRALSKHAKASQRLTGRIKAPSEPRAGTEYDFYSKVSQSDLVPTLSGLLGLPVPRNNLGVFIPEILSLWHDMIEVTIENPGVQLLYRNALQMLEIVKATFPSDEFVRIVGMTRSMETCSLRQRDGARLQCLWSRAQRLLLATSLDRRVNVEQQQTALTDFLLASQEILSRTASQYNVRNLIQGALCAALASLLAFLSLRKSPLRDMPTAFFVAVTLAHGGIMSASSYVEEEHRFWYWITSGWLAVLCATRLSHTRQKWSTLVSSLALLTLHRVATRWNQTGQKFAGAPDISRDFFPSHHLLLWALVMATYASTGWKLYHLAQTNSLFGIASASALTALVPAFVFKLNFAQADTPELVNGFAAGLRGLTARFGLVALARATFYPLGVALVTITAYSLLRPRDGRTTQSKMVKLLHAIVTIFLIVQTRVNNVPLFLLFEMQLALLQALLVDNTQFLQRLWSPASKSQQASQDKASSMPIDKWKTTSATLATLVLAMTSFFCMGGSNAISSIDLSNAYNGVSSYNAGAVGALLFAGNWAGPIWWTCAFISLLRTQGTDDGQRRVRFEGKSASTTSATAKAEIKSDAETKSDGWTTGISLLTLFVATALCSVMVSCTVLRQHLFIWTVFSPKFLYAMAWSLAWHFVVNIGIGGLVYVLSR